MNKDDFLRVKRHIACDHLAELKPCISFHRCSISTILVVKSGLPLGQCSFTQAVVTSVAIVLRQTYPSTCTVVPHLYHGRWGFESMAVDEWMQLVRGTLTYINKEFYKIVVI